MRLPWLICFLGSPLAAFERGSFALGELAQDDNSNSFAEKLFQNALPLANKSLNGRFISQMVAGTLPRTAFLRYLHQDNLYLDKYARAFAVIGAKAEDTREFLWLVNKSVSYLHEHGAAEKEWLNEVTWEEQASPVTVAYTSLLVQAAWSGDLVSAYSAVLPCQRLYDWLFATIKATRNISKDNPYKPFIDQYADPRNHQTTRELENFLNKHAASGVSAAVMARAEFHYDTAMRYEEEFFAQGLIGEDRTWHLRGGALEEFERRLEERVQVVQQHARAPPHRVVAFAGAPAAGDARRAAKEVAGAASSGGQRQVEQLLVAGAGLLLGAACFAGAVLLRSRLFARNPVGCGSRPFLDAVPAAC